MNTIRLGRENAKVIRRALNLFLLLFLLFGGTLGGLVAVFYKSQVNTFLSEIETQESLTIQLQSKEIGDEFGVIISDLLFLIEQNELHDFLRTGNAEAITGMEKEYLEILKQKKTYDQLRFLDVTGQEKLRVNLNNGNPASVNNAALQNKSKRYYFSGTFRLGPGAVFVSPLDLNVESEQIELPFKPMIRFGAPVYDAEGAKRGIVMINYLAQTLLNIIKQAGSPSRGVSMLLNSDGYWLLSDKPADEWGFMIKDRADRNFARIYPKEWEAMRASKSGQLRTNNGLFTFKFVYPLQAVFQPGAGSTKIYSPCMKTEDPLQYYWVLLSLIPEDVLQDSLRLLQLRMFLLGAGLFVIIALGAWLLALAITKRRLYQGQLISMAYYDALTSLPNRKLFFERLEAGLEHAQRHERRLGLLYIDLDGFKAVNDSMGHEAGDELLIKVSEIMRSITRKSDTVARLGGDEFAIILFEISSMEDALSAGNNIIAALAESIMLNDGKVKIGASIGAAIYPDVSRDLEMLVKCADQAMYQSKAQGKNICTAALPPK